ncbi:NUDIX domain-containing protein [Streptomyces sp. NPDC057927]
MGEMVERVDEQDRTVGVVDRGEAIRRRWLHRVATTVCRDSDGRILVHRRPDHVSRFPGQYNWLVGGAVGAGETYPAAASRELAEELGVHTPTGMPEGVFRDDPLPMHPWGRSGLTRERSSTRGHDGPPSAGRGCAGSTTA